MIVFRVIGFVLIAIALMLLGADTITSLEMRSGLTYRSFAHVLALLGGDPVGTTQGAIPPGGVSNMVQAVLSWPAWAILGVLGVIIALIAGGARK